MTAEQSTKPASATVVDYADPQTPPIAAPPQAVDRRFITGALMLVMILASMESTITSTAMPTIIGDLHGLEHYSWVFSIYLMAATVSMPLYGRLADMLGRKRVILFAIAMFCASSMLAGMAHTMWQLIIFRGIQGIGAGGIMPLVLTILGDIFTVEQRAKMQGYFSAIWGTASLAGPVLGALLVHSLGWRSIFYVNVPTGICAMLVLMWKYHDHEKPHGGDLDVLGITLLILACGSGLTLGSSIGSTDWPMITFVALGVVAALSAVWFVRHESREANPIMPLKIIANGAIWPSMIGSAVMGIGVFAIDTFVPLYVQGGRGGSAYAAAFVVSAVVLGWSTSAFVASRFVVKHGFKRIGTVGALVSTLGFAGLILGALFGWPVALLSVSVLFCGWGFGPASMAQLLSVQHVVTFQFRGAVTSGVTFFRHAGGALGVGLLGAMFNVLMSPELHRLSAGGVRPGELLDPHLRGKVDPVLLHSLEASIASKLIWVFAVMALFALANILLAQRIPDETLDKPLGMAEALETGVA